MNYLFSIPLLLLLIIVVVALVFDTILYNSEQQS